jgi:hypothetical protein
VIRAASIVGDVHTQLGIDRPHAYLDLLRSARPGEHRHGNQHSELPSPRGDGPDLQSHVLLRCRLGLRTFDSDGRPRRPANRGGTILRRRHGPSRHSGKAAHASSHRMAHDAATRSAAICEPNGPFWRVR